MTNQEKAVELLEHYFALAMGKRSAAELEPDCRVEIADICRVHHQSGQRESGLARP